MSVKELLRVDKWVGESNALFAVTGFVDQRVFVTKQGHLGAVFSLEPMSYESATEATFENVSKRIFQTLRLLDENFRLYQYVLKHDGVKVSADLDYPNELIRETVEARKKFLEARPGGLYSIELFWVLVFEPASLQRSALSTLSERKVVRLYADKLQADKQALLSKVQAIQGDLADILKPTILSKKAIFTFLRRLANLDAEVAGRVELPADFGIDNYLADQDLECRRAGIRLSDQEAVLLTLREVPQGTLPAMFTEVYKLPCSLVFCIEFKPVDSLKAATEVTNAQGHFSFASMVSNPAALIKLALNRGKHEGAIADEGAKSNIGELGELSKALNKGDRLGHAACTLLLHGTDANKLQETATDSAKIFGKFKATVTRETYNALNAYLAIQPGNSAHNKRQVWMLQSSISDMAPVYGPSAGNKRNQFLGSEYLLATETVDNTIHYLNLHNEDVFGVFGTGKTGSGKSFLSNALLDHLQKNDPVTLVLDVGGSYKQICRKYDGAYMEIGDLNIQANPFCLEDSSRTRRFLASFVRMLLQNEGYQVTFEDTRNLFDAIGEIYTEDAAKRRLCNLKLRPHLWGPLYRWIGQGEYGSIFDNDEDKITFSHFKVFDFQGIEESPEVAEPLFFYLFLRHERIVQDPAMSTKLKVLWADEAWRFLENPTCRRQFVNAGKTYRKHNGGIALFTQSAFDFKNAGLMEIISEVCPTKILLANPSADLKAYQEFFHLNEKELKLFRDLVAKRQFLVKKEEEPAQVLNFRASPLEVAYYGRSPFEDARRDAAIKEHGFPEGLRVLAAQAG